MNKLVIYGADFFDIIKLVDAINRKEFTWEIIGFIDDFSDKDGDRFWGYPILGSSEIIPELLDNDVFFIPNVSSSTDVMKKVFDVLIQNNCQIANLVHPSIDMNYVTLGRGCLLPEGTIIGGKTVIGDNVTVRLGTIISHGVVIKNHIFIGPGVIIGGMSVVHDRAYIGAGATIMRKSTINENSIVGAGTLVNKVVEANTVVVGVPAKLLKVRGER